MIWGRREEGDEGLIAMEDQAGLLTATGGGSGLNPTQTFNQPNNPNSAQIF